MTSFRSHPGIGGEVEVEAGYNQLLWGQRPSEGGSSPLYGLVRPSMAFASSGVINAYKANLEVFPISFFGISAGHENIQSDFDGFNFFDCESARCKGGIKRDYWRARMALARGPAVAMALYEESKNSYTLGDKPSQAPGEFRFAVLANPESDTHERTQYIAGYNSSYGLLAAVNENVYFRRSGQFNKMNLLIFNGKTDKGYNYTVGAGEFSSTEVDPGAIVVFQLRYFYFPSSKLF